MEQYCRYYKHTTGRTLAESRYLEQLATLYGGIMRDPSESITNPKTYVLPTEKFCSHCGTTKSIYWYEGDICHSCNVNSGVSEADYESVDENSAKTNDISIEISQKLMEGLDPAILDMNTHRIVTDKKKKHNNHASK